MPDLLNLTFRAAELATRPVRLVFGKLYEFVTEDEPAPTPAPPRPQPAPRFETPSPKAARRAARHEPTHGEAATIRAEQREQEWGDSDGPGANVIIDPAVTEMMQGDPPPAVT